MSDDAVTDVLFEAMRAYVDQLVAQGVKQTMSEQRCLRFEGAWDAGKTYGGGALVQKSGGLFACLAETTTEPGQSSFWRKLT